MNLFESRGLLLKYQENKAMSSMIKDMVPHLCSNAVIVMDERNRSR